MENTNLSKQQQVSEIMRQMLTQAQTAGQYFTNDQIKEMTRKVSAEVDLVNQQTQNQRYGSSHIGATAKDISNVVTDAASGVVDIFFFFSSRRRHTRWNCDWSSDVCSSDLVGHPLAVRHARALLARRGRRPPEVDLGEPIEAVDRAGVAAVRRLGLARRGHHRHREIGRASCRERV